jgi:hypothetical protein
MVQWYGMVGPSIVWRASTSLKNTSFCLVYSSLALAMPYCTLWTTQEIRPFHHQMVSAMVRQTMLKDNITNE